MVCFTHSIEQIYQVIQGIGTHKWTVKGKISRNTSGAVKG